jgi:hypothetical protein
LILSICFLGVQSFRLVAPRWILRSWTFNLSLCRRPFRRNSKSRTSSSRRRVTSLCQQVNILLHFLLQSPKYI